MENKKDIGKAFREKLDGLQKAPSPAVWDSISANLPRKKRGFFFLLWGKATVATKIAAVTAAVVMGIVIGYIAGQNVGGTHNYDVQDNAPIVNADSQGTQGSQNANTQNNTVAGSGDANTNASQNANDLGATSGENTSGSAANASNNKTTRSGTKNSVISGSGPDNAVVTNNTPASAKKAGNNNRSANAEGASARGKSNAGSSNTATAITGVANALNNKSNNVVASADKNIRALKNKKKRNGKSKNAKQGGIASAKGNSASGIAANEEHQPDHTKISKVHNYATGPITYKGIEIDTTDAEPADTVMMVSRQKTTGVTQYRERVKADTTTSNLKKWYAVAYVAPTQYEFPKNESLLDPAFNGYATSTDVVYNYGAYIGYNFNDKWSVRTGVLKSNVEQHTKNIGLYYTTNPDTEILAVTYPGIEYDNNSAAAISAFYGSGASSYNIKHKLEFIEVPVEVMYNIFDKRIGMNAFAGGSIINVTENKVYAYNQNGSVVLGSARNIEKTGFTGNLGLSFYYKFIPNLQVNAEPVFKYYFNTFDAKPYSLGIQVGLQYNFDIKK
ncbi:hypothetical protein FMM05_08000 [Flavobacterium zepuense]|uniref:Outer membrane protein beta-barrel domain-containing protein n=1 Tax=Flavobacterium zepuense TaxID=2593302 RepID=A0A552V473_9FLAO|nr:hypothetical protein [Flavobacterium zepuense]TRW25239.1 hypothetical protein FMM05_08000 [Flavobacterium zepuense]